MPSPAATGGSASFVDRLGVRREPIGTQGDRGVERYRAAVHHGKNLIGDRGGRGCQPNAVYREEGQGTGICQELNLCADLHFLKGYRPRENPNIWQLTNLDRRQVNLCGRHIDAYADHGAGGIVVRNHIGCDFRGLDSSFIE